MDTPGSRLKHVINQLGLTEDTVAQLLDRNVSTVYRWYTLDAFPRTIQLKIRELQESYKNINLTWVLTGEGEMLLDAASSNAATPNSPREKELLEENQKLKKKQELLDDVMLKQAKLIFEMQEEIVALKKRLKELEG